MSHERVSLAEVVGALSHALDLTEGQPLGHALRSCVIGMRIAQELGLPPAESSSLYYTLLLKDAGCSSNAARFAAVFDTDDRKAKARMKLGDWHRRLSLAFRTLRVAGAGGGPIAHVRAFLAIARTEDFTRQIIAIRCERGASIARRLGFPEETAAAIHALDEHWCGLGYPDGLAGERIPLLARIANLAQTIDAHFTEFGAERALAVARKRSGSWFDPALVRVVTRWRADDLRGWLRPRDLEHVVAALEPQDRVRTTDADGLDEIARAFADIIDAKSPYTWRHSVSVAEWARAMAIRLGWSAEEQRRLYRAGLLHDIGKLGVSNAILDKPGRLTDAERREIERHPEHSLAILLRVSAFADLAWTAALHHEALDGSGYPWKLTAQHLDPAARVLAVADIFDALTADRPYRAALPRERALAIMEAQRGSKLDPQALDTIAQLTA